MFKVLVVDDDYPVYIYLKKLILTQCECEISYAEDGAECLNFLKREKFDCIFMDISMPVMTGIDALKIIRADEEVKDIPVIMLSAVSAKEEIVKVLQLGVFDYILKPVVKQDALVRIKKFFESIRNLKSGSGQEEPDQLSQTA